MKPGSFISKEESKLLQGIAVCLMVFHHLFGFPQYIHTPYVSLLNFSFFSLETFIASYGRICVAIYAFISGYGLRKSTLSLQDYRIGSGYRSSLRRLLSFMQRYWIVFLVFVPIGLALHAFNYQAIPFWGGLLGLDYTYNESSWYTGEYIKFMVVFPILMMILKHLNHQKGNIIFTLALVIIMTVCAFLPRDYRQQYLLCFIEGIYFATVPVFEKISSYTTRNSVLNLFISLVSLLSVALGRVFGLDGGFAYVYIPFVIFGLTGLIKCTIIRKILAFVLALPAKYNTYVWLIHPFFCYSLFQKFTFFPKYSPLIFLWCMILSIASGWILESVLTLIHKGFKTLKERSQK